MNAISVLNIQLFQPEKNGSDFYFNTLKNHLKTSHKYIEKPHRHDFFVTVFFTKGKGIHEIDFTKYNVEAGCLFFLSPGQVHSWELSENADGYIFFHSQAFFDLHFVSEKLRNFPFFGSIQFSRKLGLSEHQKETFLSLFNQLETECQNENMLKNDFVLSLISLVYINSVRFFADEITSDESEKNPSYLKHYQTFEQLLELHFLKEKSAGNYAKLMQISPKHLNRITQTIVQKSATEVISDRVLLEAKRMLMYLDESLSDIAFRLGYEEYPYFARVFKKQSGLTPTQFVKKYKS